MAGDRKQLGCDEYHVAWICPVADLELLPARIMLDEEHEPPQYNTHYDENTYLFGSINNHAVVIATCPQGRTGNVNAGRLTFAMFKTFREIRMVLLVGIGGGIPSPHVSADSSKNVHLGDVVVGHPGDSKPACIYHESGRSKVNEFEITGKVQDPDWRLTNALAILTSDHGMKKTTFNDQLARLQPHENGSRFAHPGLEHDKLFKAAYCHTGGYYSRCVDCDPRELVSRPQRTLDDQHTFVFHLGRIATGNAVIQNAKQRDEIGSRCDGALCVEMEAAGVDAGRPCLVIRGISDYADSHKSDVWRNYAAGTAAAFARELLCKVPLVTAKKEKKEEVAVDYKKEEDEHEAPWLVPLPRPPSYVGRKTQLSRLNAHISSIDSCRLAVYGLGGCGKTALALETAYHTRETQPERAVFWVPAVSQASLEQAFRAIGEQLRIPNITDTKSDVKELVRKKLCDESLGQWLMIIDNADDLDVLHSPLGEGSGASRLIDYLPYSRKGSVIFTTRTRQVAVQVAGNNVIELDKLNEREAKELLRTRLFEQNQHQVENAAIVEEFLRILAFFALAIVQAVAFINQNDSSLSKYVRLYKASEKAATQLLSKKFEDEGRYRGTENSIATTWYISFEQIRKHDKLAAEYLSFMACTANTDIPATMLPEPDSELDQTEALGILKAYGFITKRQPQSDEQHEHEVQEDQPEAFDIHPLVHLATRTWLKDQNEWHSLVGQTVNRMQELVPFGDIKTRTIWTPYLPHARHVCDLAKLDHVKFWADLIDRISRCHSILGQYRIAEQELRELLAYEESALGEKHPNTLGSLNCIGETLREQKKYREAEQMHRGTLALREEVLGKEHPDTLASMNNLAVTLEKQGKSVEAEQMHRKELAVRERVSGKEHPHTLISIHNLAAVLNSQGKSAEAEQMYRETAEPREKVLGKEHPGTLSSMSILADTLSDQRKYQEAEEMHRKTLGLRENVLGKEHPDTLTSMNNLAEALSNQRRYQEAEKMHRRALALRENVLGEGHTDTLWSVRELALVLKRQYRYDDALVLYERAREGFQKNLGANHPNTRACAEECAFVQSMINDRPSGYDDYSLSDEAYKSHGEHFGSEDEDSGTHSSTEHGTVAQEEKGEAAEEGGERPGPTILLVLEESGKGPESVPHSDQVETPVHVETDTPVQKENVGRKDGRKKPPPIRKKPSLLKGVPLRSMGSGDGDEV